MRRRAALGLLAGAALAGEMDSLRSRVKAFLRDWLVRGDVERAMDYFDESCWADPLMAENQCLIGTVGGSKHPETVKGDVRRTLSVLVMDRKPALSSEQDRRTLQRLATEVKEQGLKPDPGCLRDGFVCVDGDRDFEKVIRARDDIDTHGERFLKLIQVGEHCLGAVEEYRWYVVLA